MIAHELILGTPNSVDAILVVDGIIGFIPVEGLKYNVGDISVLVGLFPFKV